MGAVSGRIGTVVRLRPPKSYFLTIIHMIRGNGATPQGSRILASLAILAVATVCVVLVVDTETTGDMTLESTRPAAEQKASTSVSATKPGAPATKLVQIPMILASDEDMRRAIYAKERKAAKAKEVRHKKHQEEEDRREHQAAQKARKQRHLSTNGMSESMKKMVAARNHEYNLEKRKKAMAAALMDDDNSMELIQQYDFSDANAIDKALGGVHASHSHIFGHLKLHRSSNHHSKKNRNAELMQIGVESKVMNFSDDITKELNDFTSSSHAVASDLLYGDEEDATRAKKKVKKVIKPKKKKKVKKKVVRKPRHRRHQDSVDEPFDENGPMAHFVAFQSAKFAMKNALGNAGKEANQSVDDDEGFSFLQLPEEDELYQKYESAKHRLHKAEQHAARSSKRHAVKMQHALELIESPTANEKAAAALKKKMNAMMSHQQAVMKRQNQQAEKAIARNTAAAKKAMARNVKEVHQKTAKINKDAKLAKKKAARKVKKAKRKARKAAKKAARKVKKAKRAARKLVKKAKAKLKEEMMLLSIETEEEPHKKASSLLAAAAKAARKRVASRTSEVGILQSELAEFAY